MQQELVGMGRELMARVLHRLGIAPDAPPDWDTLCAVYASWCRKVPFDNVQKLIRVQGQQAGPLPGGVADEFFEAWLAHGTGGTCWSGAGALHALLVAMGFEAERGMATMLAAPHLPPNHGTVRVWMQGAWYLVDTAMLHGEPLLLSEEKDTSIDHPAWGLTCQPLEGRWMVRWRPTHLPDGFDCRLESFGASGQEYLDRYDQTRDWSPFNYEAYARVQRGDEVIGFAFGNAVTLKNDGSVTVTPVDDAGRSRILRENFGMSEEIVNSLPPDRPTPPPPGSATAMARGE